MTDEMFRAAAIRGLSQNESIVSSKADNERQQLQRVSTSLADPWPKRDIGASTTKCFLSVGKKTVGLSVLLLVAVGNLALHHRFFSYEALASQIHDAPPTAELTYNHSISSYPRFLWGIASTNTPIEYERRRAIRDTYLSDHRACSFLEYALHGSNDMQNFDDCILFYAFFMGANPNGEKDLCGTNDTIPLALEVPFLEETVHDKSSNDLVFLNIRENQFEGKMTTWFKYAVSMLDNYSHLGANIDYIVKADSDTLLYTRDFFDAAKMYLPKNLMRVYAGAIWHWSWNPQGPWTPSVQQAVRRFNKKGMMVHPYVLGPVEILSADLARYVTSSHLQRSSLSILPTRSEDTQLGEYVWSHPRHVTLVSLQNETQHGKLWAHGGKTKYPSILRLMWKKYQSSNQ
jgi:hypothetical protein